MAARRKKLTWIERAAAADTKKERAALKRAAGPSRRKLKVLKPSGKRDAAALASEAHYRKKSRPSYIEQVAAAKTPRKRAALVRRTAKTEAPRSARIKTLKPSGKQDAISKASEEYTKRRAAADAVKRQMDAENAADARELSNSSKAKLRPAGIDLNLPVRGFKVLGDTALATAAAFLPDKEDKTGLKQIGRTLKGGQEAFFGLPAAAAGIGVTAVELAKHGKSKTGGRLLKGVKEDLDRRHGASYRNEPGALKAQIKRQNKEGSFAEIAEMAGPLGGPASVGAGAGARTLAAAGVGGKAVRKAAEATKARPKIRSAAGKTAKAQPQRVTSGLVGASGRLALDTARKNVQKRAVAKADAGKKPLAARRQHVKADEVAPILNRSADKKARRAVAKDVAAGRQRAQLRIDRELTQRKGGPRDLPDAKTLRQNTVKLTPRDAAAMLAAQELGIGSSAAARAILPKRIEKLREAREAAPRRRGEPSQDNLPELEALLKDPSVFDKPEFQRVVDIENARAERVVGPAQGMAPERSRGARYQPLSHVLGIERKTAETAEAFQARAAAELGVVRLPDDKPGAYARRLGRAVEDARSGKGGPHVEAERRAGESVPKYTERLSKELGISKGLGEGDQAFRGRLVAATQRVRESSARKESGAPLVRNKGETATEHIDRVAAAAAALGLKEPGFRASRYNEADESVIGGLNANPNPATSAAAREGALFREGRENTDPRIQEQSLAASIRRGESQKMQDKLIDREGTIYTGRSEAEAAAEALADGVAVPLGRTRTGQAEPSGPPDGDYSPTDAWAVLPEAAYREYKLARENPGRLARAADKAQGLQSATLLGASLSWAQFQLLADGFAGATAGGLHRVVHNNRLYKNASDEFRENIDVLAGGSPANDALLLASDKRMGTLSKMVDVVPGYAKYFEGRKNPLTALLRADAAKSLALRRSAIIQRLAVDAKTARIDGELAALAPAQRMLRTAATKAEPDSLAKFLRERPDVAEAHGEHVNTLMGDFSNYTARERATLRRFVPFYGFLRYSVRLSLYTLPVQHPALAGIIASVGHMGAEDAKDFVGEDLPFGLSSLFNADGTQAINLARANPAVNALTGITKSTQLAGMLPPVVGLAANWAFQRNLFLDRGYKVDGVIEDNNDMTAGQRARVAANELLSMIGVYRDLEKADARAQGDDSLVGSRRPLVPRSAETRASFAKQQAERTGTPLQRVLENASPIAGGFVESPLKSMGKRATEKKAEKAEKIRMRGLRDKGRTTDIGKARAEAEDMELEFKAINEEMIPDSVKQMVKEINDDRIAQGLPPLRKPRPRR